MMTSHSDSVRRAIIVGGTLGVHLRGRPEPGEPFLALPRLRQMELRERDDDIHVRLDEVSIGSGTVTCVIGLKEVQALGLDCRAFSAGTECHLMIPMEGRLLCVPVGITHTLPAALVTAFSVEARISSEPHYLLADDQDVRRVAVPSFAGAADLGDVVRRALRVR